MPETTNTTNTTAVVATTTEERPTMSVIVELVRVGKMSKSEGIRQIMARGGVSQYAVSKALGIRPQFVSNVMMAKRLKATKNMAR